MKFQGESELLQRMDSTAMADIIFNLLIFFLLSSTFLVESGLKLDLPKVVQPASLAAEDVVVTLTRGEALFVNDRSVVWPEMEGELAIALDGAKERRVIVRGDEQVPLGRVVEVMDAARRLGATGLALAARPLEESEIPRDRARGR